jgi:peptide/nickel transport system substrate-binding protein
MKKIILSVIVFSFALSGLFPTGKKDAAPSPTGQNIPAGGAAVYAVYTEPLIIPDPSDTFSNEIIVFQNVYETLLRYDIKTKSFENLLAESYSKTQDGLTWTFKLRQGVKFHTGGVLLADTVKRSIERTRSRAKGASYIWEAVERITVIDPLTVEFNLKFAEAFENVVASAYGAYIFDVDAVEKNGDAWFTPGRDAGSGPYTIKSWTPAAELVLAYFPDYWKGWDKKNFVNVVFKTVPESNTRQLQLEAGEVDIAADLLAEQLEAIKRNPDLRVEQAEEFKNLSLEINTLKPPLNNRLVRQALAYAIPYDDIVQKILRGNAEQSSGYLPKGLWGQDPGIFKYSYNIDKSRELLAQAGVRGGNLTITYVAGDDVERQIAELLQSKFAEIGFTLRIQAMPWDAQWDRAKATNPNDRQDLFLIYYWAVYADPYSYLSMAYKTENPIIYNLGYYSNPEFDALLDRAHSIAGKDRSQAIVLYKQAQEILVRDVPGIALLDTRGSFGYRANFKGYRSNPYYAGVVFFYDAYR